MTAPAPVSASRLTVRTAWRLMAIDRRSYASSWVQWVTFHAMPVPIGLALKAVLDRVSGDAGATSVWVVLAVLAGLEVGRWAGLVSAVVQWAGGWTGWQSVPRLNLLRSLVADPGPAAGRLPSSSGEAVSRFRDDTNDLALVLDVWLDMSGAIVATTSALIILATIDARITGVVIVPVLAALLLARALGPRLKAWRVESREAAAAVTGFLGDTFGGVQAVKAAGAEAAVSRRFAELNDVRRRAARRDQVGTAMVQSLGGVTGEIGVGLVLLLAAPALRRGDLSVGDIGLFASYVTVLASLPRWAGRLGAYHRQAEVSIGRLADLTPERSPSKVVARPAAMDLRHGPAPLVKPAPVAAPPSSGRLEVVRLTARHPGGGGVSGIDLDVEPGSLVVVTGPVGSGKSTLLRAVLGLIPREAGTIRFDGEEIDDPSLVLVPPRVAYVPQVPRLFSETLADTVLLGLPADGLASALSLAQLPDVTPETMVGPKGVRLSGGQIQRAATARALVRKPALLVVDDLSSALDVATETALWDGLLGDGGAVRTALVVTHRPQVIARADHVVRLG